MTWKFGRPLVLKSPPHTCRIRLLLEMFPDARFVHIHRDPYAVFRSTRGTIRTDKTLCLQEASDSPDPDARIIRRYRIMYDSFFEERHLIPEGRFHELSFEELERDPVGVVRRIYEHLDIHGFEEFEPSLKRYAGSVSGYRKNEFPELPETLREKIAHAWERSFEEWGYPRS
jgi:LPS sulfotransferase NodH